MPREKTIFFIGIWIILLSNFIGLPTEIKNYLFIATAVLLVVMSYSSNISEIDTDKNFFRKKTIDKKPETKEVKFEEKNTFRASSITSLKKESDFATHVSQPVIRARKKKPAMAEPEKVVSEESSVDLSNPFADISKSYEPVIKVRRARIKPKAKLVREEAPIESNFNMDSEEDDVIVISSDGDTIRE